MAHWTTSEQNKSNVSFAIDDRVTIRLIRYFIRWSTAYTWLYPRTIHMKNISFISISFQSSRIKWVSSTAFFNCLLFSLALLNWCRLNRLLIRRHTDFGGWLMITWTIPIVQLSKRHHVIQTLHGKLVSGVLLTVNMFLLMIREKSKYDDMFRIHFLSELFAGKM